MSDTTGTLIPQSEIDALAARIDEVQPWRGAGYSMFLFYRKYFCTMLAILLSIVAAPGAKIGLLIIALVLFFDIYTFKRIYEHRLSNSELVQKMYGVKEGVPVWTSRFKWHIGVYACGGMTLLLIRVLVKLEWLPSAEAKYLFAAICMGLAMYSSVTSIQKRIERAVYSSLKDYADLDSKFYGKSANPFGGLFYFYLPDKIRLFVHALVICFSVSIIFLLLIMIIDEPFVLAPWRVFLTSTVAFSGMVALFLFGYTRFPFLLKCSCINKYRIESEKK